MSEEPENAIKAEIEVVRYSSAETSRALRQGGRPPRSAPPEHFQFSAVGDDEIRRVVCEIAGNALPDRRERMTITFHVSGKKEKKCDRQYVMHLFVASKEEGRGTSLAENSLRKVYFSYGSYLDDLDAVLELLNRKRDAIKRRDERERQRREDCAGLLDYMAEEEDLPAFGACVCPDCKGTAFHWQKEAPEQRRPFAFPDEKNRIHRFARLRPRWVLICDGCGEKIPEMLPTDFIKDAESGILYAYDERNGRFSIFEADDAKEPWNCFRRLSDEEEEALPERIKELRKVGADYREEHRAAKARYVASRTQMRAQAAATKERN